jgi:hypothetical protein
MNEGMPIKRGEKSKKFKNALFGLMGLGVLGAEAKAVFDQGEPLTQDAHISERIAQQKLQETTSHTGAEPVQEGG